MRFSIKQLLLLVFLTAIGIAMASNDQRGNEAKAQIKTLENDIESAERELVYQKNSYNDALKIYRENSDKRIGLQAIRDFCGTEIIALQEKLISRQRIGPEYVSIKSLPRMRVVFGRRPVAFSIHVPKDSEVWLQLVHDLEILDDTPSVSQNQQTPSPREPRPKNIVKHEAKLTPGYHVLEWVIPSFDNALIDMGAVNLILDSKLLYSSEFLITSVISRGTSGSSDEMHYPEKDESVRQIFSCDWTRETDMQTATERTSFDLRLSHKPSGYDQFPELP
ncbi:MAG: hypothetical protein ACON4H_04350 [Rubripirellula sp.]